VTDNRWREADFFLTPMYSIASAIMVTHDSPDPSPKKSFWQILRRSVFSLDHKVIGLNYLWLALGSVFLGMGLSLLMRIHLVWPGVHIPFSLGNANNLAGYSALTLLHGSLMVFMVLTTAPQAGFGNYFLPLQIGARNMAFPALNSFSFWMTVASLLGITLSFFTPFEFGLTLWVASVALFCFGSVCTALNFSVTTIDLRANGMTLPRMPLTAWAWFLTAILSSLIFNILLAACGLLLSDRILGTQFFSAPQLSASAAFYATEQGVPFLWQRLFWFFAQAEAYVAMLPCLGIVSHLLSNFARKPVWALRAVVLALCGVGLFGFCIWGFHVFQSGINPYAPPVFAIVAESLGLPAVIFLVSWFGTLWNGRIQLTTAMLFAIGFVSLFISGGLSGLFLARHDVAAAAINDEFIAGHFHLVMGVAATFAILSALFFWFPKMFGPSLNETLGKVHFWLTFAGVYCVFMPMHWMGLLAHSRATQGSSLAPANAETMMRDFITVATVATISAQAIFLFNFVWTLWRGEKSDSVNPWRATTLEWTVASHTPPDNFGPFEPVVYRGAYELFARGGKQDFLPQSLAPESAGLSEPASFELKDREGKK
jgi:cytochrome c oxidase subunit I